MESQREFTEEHEDPLIIGKLSAAIANVKQTSQKDGGAEAQDFAGNVTKATRLLQQVRSRPPLPPPFRETRSSPQTDTQTLQTGRPLGCTD